MSKHNPKQNQLTLPGFTAWTTPGYPIRGLMRCLALCTIYGWTHLGELAGRQLAKMTGGES